MLSVEEPAGIKTWDLGDIVGVTCTLQGSGKGDLFVDMNGYLKLIGTSVMRACPHRGVDCTYCLNPAADYNDMMDLYKFLSVNIVLRKGNYDNINDTARWP